MLNIEYMESLDEKLYKIIDIEFNNLAAKNGLICDYTPFNFVAKEENKVVGIITGYTFYNEVHVADLVILEEYRKKHIGTKLIQTVEENFKNKGFENINLATYSFQAPEFYKKCGFKLEFIREDKENSKLNKYFLIKRLG